MKKIFVQTLCAVILLLFIDFLFKYDNKYIDLFFDSSFNYRKIDFKISKLFGISNDSYVNRELLDYSKYEYNDGVNHFIFDGESVIKNISGGTVTFIGNKNDGDNVLIIEGDKYTFTYKSIDNISVNLYDYVSKNEILGSAVNNEIYLTISCGDKNYKYEDIN